MSAAARSAADTTCPMTSRRSGSDSGRALATMLEFRQYADQKIIEIVRHSAGQRTRCSEFLRVQQLLLKLLLFGNVACDVGRAPHCAVFW